MRVRKPVVYLNIFVSFPFLVCSFFFSFPIHSRFCMHNKIYTNCPGSSTSVCRDQVKEIIHKNAVKIKYNFSDLSSTATVMSIVNAWLFCISRLFVNYLCQHLTRNCCVYLCVWREIIIFMYRMYLICNREVFFGFSRLVLFHTLPIPWARKCAAAHYWTIEKLCGWRCGRKVSEFINSNFFIYCYGIEVLQNEAILLLGYQCVFVWG